ncbi:amidase signature domain-containing protein [Leptodontidium sp. MPI-SDFR-AT-0119]|nr:amidase signature domain-containing protein [Leptodontidium sp. MPI-SDFR-AT-0119]
MIEKASHISNTNDAYLHAVLELCPEPYRRADFLDEERRAGLVRGPLHGIPILLKDNIATHASLGMNTTGGSLALVGSRPKKNAEIVDKSTKIFPGWSAAVGNVNLDDGSLGHSSPSGSSTWSAVAVSAGYCPIAIGTDTFGSLITTPSTRAALYSLRSTVDLISRRGIIPISELFDTTRPMAKSVVDLANLMDVLVTPGHKTHSFLDALPGTFKDINIGVLRPEDWFFDSSIQRRIPSASAQIIASIYDAYAKINAHAKSLQEVSLISADELVVNGTHSFFEVLSVRFKKNLEGYLKSLDNHIYNNQDQLVRAENNDLPEEQQAKLLRHARWISRDLGIDKTLKDYGVDVIIVPADSSFNLLVSAAGYPSATMPLSYLDYNGLPIGLAVFTTAHNEKLLLRVLSAWEAICNDH